MCAVGLLECNGLHDDQVCATAVLLRNAAVVAAAILHPLVNIMVLTVGASGNEYLDRVGLMPSFREKNTLRRALCSKYEG